MWGMRMCMLQCSFVCMHNQKLLVQETHLEQLLEWLLGLPLGITARIDKEYLQSNDAKDDLKNVQ